MTIQTTLTEAVQKALAHLYRAEATDQMIQLQQTKREFEGHLTLVVFPFTRMSHKKPEDTAQEIGEYMLEQTSEVAAFNVIKGFLNLTISSTAWMQLLLEVNSDAHYGYVPVTDASPLAMIEYSSPNTNKPLHLGHVRNNLLGSSLARVMEACGNKVVKTNIVNDRGIHICKSMLAWKKYGQGETPESSGKKGDHLVGDYYVAFDKHYKAELKDLMENQHMTQEEAEQASSLM
ncbi:MAG: arginine--tRNA ligase, partial [Bacteroidaceae bacterium]